MQVLVFSGRELFMADASVFVDDAEAYEVYERDEESEANKQTVKNDLPCLIMLLFSRCHGHFMYGMVSKVPNTSCCPARGCRSRILEHGVLVLGWNPPYFPSLCERKVDININSS
jgi:hypothetical protein